MDIRLGEGVQVEHGDCNQYRSANDHELTELMEMWTDNDLCITRVQDNQPPIVQEGLEFVYQLLEHCNSGPRCL